MVSAPRHQMNSEPAIITPTTEVNNRTIIEQNRHMAFQRFNIYRRPDEIEELEIQSD